MQLAVDETYTDDESDASWIPISSEDSETDTSMETLSPDELDDLIDDLSIDVYFLANGQAY